MIICRFLKAAESAAQLLSSSTPPTGEAITSCCQFIQSESHDRAVEPDSPRRRNDLPTRVSKYPSQLLLVWRNFLYLKKRHLMVPRRRNYYCCQPMICWRGIQTLWLRNDQRKEEKDARPYYKWRRRSLAFFFLQNGHEKKNVQKTLNIPYKRPTQFHSADKNRFNDPTTSSHSIIKDCHDFSRCLLERRVRKLPIHL